MEPTTISAEPLADTTKRFARRLLTIGENRLELLMVEVQEERERLLRSFFLALGVAIFGLLAGITLTAAIAVLFWPISPLAALITLACLHGLAALWLQRRLAVLLSNWQIFPANLEQLRKDRLCLEENLA
jgi:uncharacterized membrane protein YqjE